MKKVFKGFMVAAAVTLSAGVALNAAADTAKLDQLLEQVKKDRISEAKIDQAREQEFLSDRADKQALLNKAKSAFSAEEARGKALTKKYAENEGALATKAAELQTALGTLGEVVGMVRQNAAETIGSISSSVISAQYPGRAELLSKLASAKEVPNIKELEDLWIALQTEMTESAKNAKFETQVVNLDGSTETKQVTRIGSLSLMSDAQYLLYNADTQQVQPLGRDPEAHIVATVADYAKAGAGDVAHHVDGADDRVFDVLVPGDLGHGLVGVAPAHHKGAVALLHRVADHGVGGLQVEDVELVDAGRHHQERALIDLGAQRLVFDELEQLVLEHHRAFGGGHVLADLEHALVGHGHMALLHVVQQVGHALGDALALGLDGLFLGFGVEGQEVAGRHGSHPLFHAKADAGLGLFVSLDRVGQPHEGAGIEQVGCG